MLNKTESLILLHLRGNGWVSIPDLVSNVFNDIGNTVSRDVIRYTARDLFQMNLINSKVIDHVRHYKG